MQASFNSLPLLSVKPSLDSSLASISREVEAFFASGGKNLQALKNAQEELHRIGGVLRMLSMTGLSVFCGEIENLLREITPPQDATPALRDVVRRALFGLTHYLDAVADGASNATLRLFHEYQELHQARGLEMAFEVDLFYPALHVQLPEEILKVPQQAEAAAHIKTARLQYQQALLKWLRQDNAVEALQTMTAAVQTVMTCVAADRHRGFWWISAGLLDCIVHDGVPSDQNVKKSLSRIDLHMKSLADGAAFDEETALSEMLYLIARSHTVSDRVEQIKAVYALEDYLPEELPKPPGEILAVLEEMRAQLVGAGEAWERCCTEGGEACKKFAEDMEKLLGHSELLDRNTLQFLCKQMHTTALHSDDAERAQRVSMDMAMALLLLNSGIEHYQHLGSGFHEQARILSARLQASMMRMPEDVDKLSSLISLYRQMEQREVMAPLATEMQGNLQRVEQSLTAFFADAAKRSELTQISRLMSQVQGGMRILSLDIAEQLLNTLRQVTDRYVQGETPSPGEMRKVAATVSALEDYVSGLAHGQKPDPAMLSSVLHDIAETSIGGGRTEAAKEEEAAPAGVHIRTGSVDEELLEVFLEEAREVMETLRANLDVSRGQLDNREALVTMRRAFHTLKGSGRMVGLTELGEVAWAIERAMNKWLQENKPATSALLDMIGDAEVLFQHWVDMLRSGSTTATIDTTNLLTMADCIENGKEMPQAQPKAERPVVAEKPAAAPQAPVAEPVAAPAPVVEAKPALAVEPVAAPEPVKAVEPALATAEIAAEMSEEEEEEAGPVQIGALSISPVLFNIATEEATGKMKELKSHLAELAASEDRAVSYDFMRAAHTLAGVNRTLGFMQIGELAIALELWLQERINKPNLVNAQQLLMIGQAVQRLDEMCAAVRQRREPQAQPELIAKLQADREATVGEQLPAAAPELTMGAAQAQPQPAAQEVAVPEIDLSDIALEFAETPVESVPEKVEPAFEIPEFDMLEAPAAQPPQAVAPAVLEVPELELPVFAAEEPAAAQPIPEQEVPELELPKFAEEPAAAEIAPEPEEYELVHFSHLQAEPATAVEPKLEIPELELPVSAEEPTAAEIAPEPEEYELVHFSHLQAEPAPAEEAKPEVPAQEMTPPPATVQPASMAEVQITPETAAPTPAVQGAAQTAATEAPLAAMQHRERTVHDEIDEQLLPIFLEEANELYPQIGVSMRAWREQPADPQAARLLQRNLHTLKGSARMAGAMRLGELTHRVEGRIDKAVNEGIDESLWSEMDNYLDRIGNAIEQLKHPHAERRAEDAAAQQAGHAPEAAQAAAPQALEIGAERAMQAAMLRVRSDKVDHLVNEAGEISVARARAETELGDFKNSVLELTESVNRLRKQLREVEIQAESQMQARVAISADSAEKFDPLEFDRFTRFQELTRFLNESVHDVQTIQQTLLKNLAEIEAALNFQAQLNRDLQQGLMAIRMVPFSSIGERLYRIVRQTGKEMGKRANLELSGTEVELDRSVLEKMTAPFEHLLRNSIAHGLEMPEQREKANKAPIGEIRLSLRQESNEVVFVLSDDGAGLNLQRLREKAVEKGIVQSGEELSDDQAMQLIFSSGISTAKELTEISGRGIGMDVVRSEITALGGRVDVASETGHGVRFTIHLPLTLAVTKVLMVRAGQSIYALPSTMIEHVQQVKSADLDTIYKQQYVDWQGKRYPLHHMARLLGDEQAEIENLPHNPVLLVGSGESRVALHVDELRGNHEAVVKNIGPQLARMPGIAGATVSGSGEVILILNPIAFTQRIAGIAGVRKTAPDKAVAAVAKAEPVRTVPSVMVVDDSLTVRKITGRMLARAGYQVLTAKDGVDALEQLMEVTPDVMLLDVEMPRMDGFELAKRLRQDSKTQKLPIIMITSRTADKHRHHALEIGVNEYMGKPYQEEELLAHIARFVAAAAPQV